jgi:hypothetical protein
MVVVVVLVVGSSAIGSRGVGRSPSQSALGRQRNIGCRLRWDGHGSGLSRARYIASSAVAMQFFRGPVHMSTFNHPTL